MICSQLTLLFLVQGFKTLFHFEVASRPTADWGFTSASPRPWCYSSVIGAAATTAYHLSAGLIFPPLSLTRALFREPGPHYPWKWKMANDWITVGWNLERDIFHSPKLTGRTFLVIKRASWDVKASNPVSVRLRGGSLSSLKVCSFFHDLVNSTSTTPLEPSHRW